MSTSKNTRKAAAMTGAQDMNSKAGKASAGRASSVKAKGSEARAAEDARILAEAATVTSRSGRYIAATRGHLRTAAENLAIHEEIRMRRREEREAMKRSGEYVPFDVRELVCTPDFTRPEETYDIREVDLTVRKGWVTVSGRRFKEIFVHARYPLAEGTDEGGRLEFTTRFHISPNSALASLPDGVLYRSAWRENVVSNPGSISLSRVERVKPETGERFVNVWAGLRSDRRVRGFGLVDLI